MIMAIPGITKLLRPRKPRMVATIAAILAFILMGVAQSIVDSHIDKPNHIIVSAIGQENGSGYISGEEGIIESQTDLGPVGDDGSSVILTPSITPVSNQQIPSGEEGANFNTTCNMTLHFIDVGQGDATLLESDGHYMLIDMGPESASDSLVKYLKAQKIKRLDYLVLTHPHADHVNASSTKALTKNFDIETVLMPDVSSSTGYAMMDYTLDILDEAGADTIIAYVNDCWTLGNATITALAPNSSYYDELNNYSLVVRISDGASSAIITADAEEFSEQEMMLKRRDLNADILRVGHHGSTTSTSALFLLSVSPDHCIISCGVNNEYGHPHEETITKLWASGANIYRTDVNGSITASCMSDGSIIFSKER